MDINWFITIFIALIRYKHFVREIMIKYGDEFYAIWI